MLGQLRSNACNPNCRPANTGYGSVAVAPDSQKVLRNTYLLLALTMVPTVIGAWIGMQTAWIMQSCARCSASS